MSRQLLSIAVTCVSVGLVGCQEAEPPAYAPNLVYRYVVEQMGDQDLGPVVPEVDQIVETHFGTLAAKSVPEGLADVIDAGKLGDGHAAYDKYCAACHGTDGDGRGPAAALLTPYPRDYRPGVFKFKSSLPGEKPLHSDIAEIIERGVPGTAMKPVKELNEADREAVAHYVTYLSARGEFERSLLMAAGLEMDLETKYFLPLDDETSEYVEYPLEDLADAWLGIDSYLESVDVPAYFTDPSLAADRVAAAKRGKEHFATKDAACATCHRFDKDGKALPTSEKKLYDVWTEEWTTRIQLDPEKEAELVPIIARGALPPREATPRRLGFEPLRGGDDPRAVFAKIKFGIEGTPMPKTQIADNEVLWDLVAHVMEESSKVPEEPSMAPADDTTTTTEDVTHTHPTNTNDSALASTQP